jgi:cation transport ATPase
MDVLVMPCTSAAYFYYLLVFIVSTLNPDPDALLLKFDANAMLLTFVSLSRNSGNCRRQSQRRAY